FPGLTSRIDEADEIVYPAYSECDRDARSEQNRWRWFTVLAIVGGFLTTMFAATQAWLQSAVWPGVAVVTIGAATTALTTVARRQGALSQYLTARLRAERLRSLYFQHVTGALPTDDADSGDPERTLRRRVAEIEHGEVVL